MAPNSRPTPWFTALALAVALARPASAVPIAPTGEPALAGVANAHPEWHLDETRLHYAQPGTLRMSDELLFGQGGPRPGDVRQRYVGSCGLLATLASAPPEWLANRFARRRDGRLKLDAAGRAFARFYNKDRRQWEEVAVSPLVAMHGDETLGADPRTPEGTKLWASALEKAYVAWRYGDAGWRRFAGGWAYLYMEELTGTPGHRDVFGAGPDEGVRTLARVRLALARRELIVAGTVERAEEMPPRRDEMRARGRLGHSDQLTFEGQGLHWAHGYAVTGLREVHGGQLIELYDPHGEAHIMPVETFMVFFHFLETSGPLT